MTFWKIFNVLARRYFLNFLLTNLELLYNYTLHNLINLHLPPIMLFLLVLKNIIGRELLRFSYEIKKKSITIFCYLLFNNFIYNDTETKYQYNK